MASRPPLSDSIVIAMSRLIDDAQTDTPEPSHSDIEFQIDRAGLASADPGRQGKPVGKAKRVRGTLSWAMSNDIGRGQILVAALIAAVRGYGGFRTGSSNYCGTEAIENLRGAFATEGWDMGSDGSIQPRLLDSLSGKALSAALRAYVDRARNGALDDPLVTGTAKDLLEATAAHVLVQKWGSYSSTSNFPTLLGQAFSALAMATPMDPIVAGEPVQKRLERSAYELGCALNALRNKQGTGHGRPWESTVTKSQSRFAIESMGNIAALMLDALGP